MAYKVIILYRLYMPSYFLGTFTEYPYLHRINKRTDSKENKKKFKDAVKRGCKDAISFKPSIEYLP